MYKIEKNLNRLQRGEATFFLDPKQQQLLKGKLKKGEYKIFRPYKDSESNIFYIDKEPKVILYEIKINSPIRHQDILGSIYALNITKEMFGDILIIDNKYYIYVLENIRNYLESNFSMIKNSHIELIEKDINFLKDYEKSYEELELIVSSNRMDTIGAVLCHTGRVNIKEKCKNKEIMLNYDFLKDPAYKLKTGDIFSIKKIGKFKYNGEIKRTKSDNLIISIDKYL